MIILILLRSFMSSISPFFFLLSCFGGPLGPLAQPRGDPEVRASVLVPRLVESYQAIQKHISTPANNSR